MKLKRSDHPWPVFLRARAELIQHLSTQGKEDSEILQTLSMDTMQVTLIRMASVEGIGMVVDVT